MTLLNSTAMFAAAAVIVPILVHLRKRSKSKVVDWPAMQFLRRTVTSRRRGLMLENLLLLLLRCLLVLLFVFAMARPVIESDRILPWLLFSLFAGCGVLLLNASVVGGWRRGHRLTGVVVAVLLFGGAGAMLSTSPESLIDSAADRDVAIVIDSSLTMTIGDDETSHFDNAISQARSLVETLSGNSTVAIVMAGPIPETVDGSPFRNLRRAEDLLGTLEPVAGGSDLESAIQQATILLKKAPNTRKQILLLTDDQLCTWESVDEIWLNGHSFATDQTVSISRAETGMSNKIEVEGNNAREAVTIPEIACAAIVARLPQKTSNISVDRLLINTSLVTVDRPVPIEVEVRNGGTTSVRDLVVKLLVNGRETSANSLIQLEPGGSSTIRFLHAFQQAGQHVVSGTVEIADQLHEDNRVDSVVDVIPHLSVLVVNGSTDADPTQQSATFVRLALDPASLHELQMVNDRGNAAEGNVSRAIVTTTIEAARLDEFESLEDFQLVMLCDVPRLPIDAAERIANFVEDGGELWVIPGEHTDVSFYNNWRGPLTEERVMPVEVIEWSQWSGEASPTGQVSRLGVALDHAGRSFIGSLFERGDHELADVSIFQFWSTIPSEEAIVGMRLTNGELFFADKAIGRGRVLMQSVPLARRSSNFPANLGFPVLMHLWTNHLTASFSMGSNFEATSDLVTELAAQIDSTEKIQMLQLVEPDGTERNIPISWEQDSPLARIGQVMVPGVYKLQDKRTEATVSSFTIHRDLEESDLSVVHADRLQEIGHGLGIEFIDDVKQLTSPVFVESIGTEIWEPLLFCVLWLLAAECLVTKWIRSRRGMVPVVTFVSHNPNGRFPPVTIADTPSQWANAPVDDSLSLTGEAL